MLSEWVQKKWLSPEIDSQTVQPVASNYIFHHADNFFTDFLVQNFLEGFIIHIITKYTACARYDESLPCLHNSSFDTSSKPT
jgi:hypothetical protein